MKEITLRVLRPPVEDDIDLDIQWFCRSLGLLGKRDVNNTGFKIFKILLENCKEGCTISVNEIAQRVGMTRTGIVHHLNIMRNAGLVINQGTHYELRMRSLQKTVDEIRLDIERVIQTIRDVATDIDKRLNLPVRYISTHA